MKELHRVVEDQASLNSYRATQDEDKAVQLEILIEQTKPILKYSGWHDLVATPFRYSLPIPSEYQARFRPPLSMRNVFYASACLETSLYEYSFHFMRQRVHLLKGRKRKKKNETGIRTAFSLNTDDTEAFDISSHPKTTSIMDRSNYEPSHEFIKNNSNVDYIIYPSVRDPLHRKSAAILNIERLSKEINGEGSLNFFYNYSRKQVYWIQPKIEISWQQVSSS